MRKRHQYEWVVATLDDGGEHEYSEFFDSLADAIRFGTDSVSGLIAENTVLLLRRTNTRDSISRDIVIDYSYGQFSFRSIQFDSCYRWNGPCSRNGVECECQLIPERYQLELQSLRA